MTTPPAVPLDKFRATRDQLLNTVLSGLGDLETSVIRFEHDRSVELASARRSLEEAQRENERLKGELADRVEQPAGPSQVAQAAAEPAVVDTESAARVELLEKELASVKAAAAHGARLDARLAEARADADKAAGELRTVTTQRDQAVADLDRLRASSKARQAATEDLQEQLEAAKSRVAELEARPAVTGITEQEVEARIAGLRADAAATAQAEGLRILHAIQADNPGLSLDEALDLFTVAYGTPDAVAPEAAAPALGLAPVVLPEPETVLHDAPALAPVIALPDLDEDPFADEPVPAPAAFAPVVVPAADPVAAEADAEDPITDPHFFDIPPALAVPVPATEPAAPVLATPGDGPVPVPPPFTGPVDALPAAPAAVGAIPAPAKAFPVPAVQSLDLDFDLFAEPEPEKKVA